MCSFLHVKILFTQNHISLWDLGVQIVLILVPQAGFEKSVSEISAPTPMKLNGILFVALKALKTYIKRNQQPFAFPEVSLLLGKSAELTITKK